jgi:hypothetical protein
MIAVDIAHTDPLWQNPNDRWDVNHDGDYAPNDLLALTSVLNGYGATLLNQPRGTAGFLGGTTNYLDVTGDNVVPQSDMLDLIDILNGGSGTVAQPHQNSSNSLDVNGDNVVNDDDEQAVLSYLAGIASSGGSSMTYDVSSSASTPISSAVVRTHGQSTTIAMSESEWEAVTPYVGDDTAIDTGDSGGGDDGGGGDTGDDPAAAWWPQFMGDVGGLGIRPDAGDSNFQNLFTDLMTHANETEITPDWTNPLWVDLYTLWMQGVQQNGIPSGGGGGGGSSDWNGTPVIYTMPAEDAYASGEGATLIFPIGGQVPPEGQTYTVHYNIEGITAVPVTDYSVADSDYNTSTGEYSGTVAFTNTDGSAVGTPTAEYVVVNLVPHNYDSDRTLKIALSDAEGATLSTVNYSAIGTIHYAYWGVDAENDGEDLSYWTFDQLELDVPANQGVLMNDVDEAPDAPPDDLEAVIDEDSAYPQPQHGTVSLQSDGSFTYIPTQGYSGLDPGQSHLNCRRIRTESVRGSLHSSRPAGVYRGGFLGRKCPAARPAAPICEKSKRSQVRYPTECASGPLQKLHPASSATCSRYPNVRGYSERSALLSAAGC